MYLTRDKIIDYKLPTMKLLQWWINRTVKLPNDEITDDEFTARWNYQSMKLPTMNLQHGESYKRLYYRTLKLPHDKITHDNISGSEITTIILWFTTRLSYCR